MIVGCYAMDLYCRNQTSVFDEYHRLPGHINYVGYPTQYTGQTEEACKIRARNRGWVFNRDGDVTCYKCSKKKVYHYVGRYSIK